MFRFKKQSDEKEIIGINFSRRVPVGVDIVLGESSVSVTPLGIPGDAQGTNLQATGLTLTGKTMTCMITDGIDGYEYNVSFKASLSDGQLKEEDVIVKVENT